MATSSTLTNLSTVYSLQKGYASERVVVEAMLQFGRPSDRVPFPLVVGFALVLLVAIFVSYVLGALLLALFVVASPFLLGAWHERRLRRVGARIRAERLCLGCAYPLAPIELDDAGGGVCPECGRAFRAIAYAPPREVEAPRSPSRTAQGRDREIRAAIRAFLDLIESEPGDVPGREARLPVVLDRLAATMNTVVPDFEDAEWPDAPRHDQDELRGEVARRFPNYGYYNVPASISRDIAATECVVGDAIDDLLDIANDLLEVEWHWTHTSRANALWHLDFSYRHHWRAHLRELQTYLDALEHER